MCVLNKILFLEKHINSSKKSSAFNLLLLVASTKCLVFICVEFFTPFGEGFFQFYFRWLINIFKEIDFNSYHLI